MKTFSPMKKEDYTESGVGPGKEVLTLTEWNLTSLCSRCLFGFENDQPSSKLAGEIDVTLMGAIKNTVYQNLGGKRISYYMGLDSPWGFYEALRSTDNRHLYVSKWHKGGLQGLVKARCYAWEKVKRSLTKNEQAFVILQSQRYQK